MQDDDALDWAHRHHGDLTVLDGWRRQLAVANQAVWVVYWAGGRATARTSLDFHHPSVQIFCLYNVPLFSLWVPSMPRGMHGLITVASVFVPELLRLSWLIRFARGLSPANAGYEGQAWRCHEGGGDSESPEVQKHTWEKEIMYLQPCL